MRTSDSTTKLIEALVAARVAFTPIHRDAVGQVGSDRQYRYADLAGLLEATIPALTANGLAVLQAVDAETSTLVTRVAHTSGEWVESSYPLTLTVQPQQLGSSITYGRRYSLQSLLCVAADDDDGAAAQAPPPTKRATKETKAPAVKGEPITQAQRKRLFAMATANGWTTDELKDYLQRTYSIASSKDITTATYDAICRDLDHGTGEAPF